MTPDKPATVSAPPKVRSRDKRLRGRPAFFQSYEQELALFNTRPKQIGVLLIIVVAALIPFAQPDAFLRSMTIAFVFAIAALGLNLVTGLAGQVSLGHALFFGIGAYTAAVISGDPDGRALGLGIEEMWIWLPAAGLAAALVGVVVAPIATRLRGLYLAIVTLGLVFIGEHIFREWASVTGGAGIGRSGAELVVAGQDLASSTTESFFTVDQKRYLVMLVLLIVFAVAARNIARSRVGRAFTAVRDRDMAAEMMGIDLPRTKTLAFGLSSFYAGCAGGLYVTIQTNFEGNFFNLALSVMFIAMVLIGGAGTVGGTIAGAMLIGMLPTLIRDSSTFLTFINTAPNANPNILQLNQVLYGLLIIGFLLFEPRGLFGIWARIRTYWKSWPFSY